MVPDDLMRVALRVLEACTSGTYPNAADVHLLRAAASLSERDGEVDALARRIVERELHRTDRRRAAL